MIRHLPNNHSVLESDLEANIQYHTNNKFLESYGGNLFHAFEEYSLTPTSAEDQISGKSVLFKFYLS